MAEIEDSRCRASLDAITRGEYKQKITTSYRLLTGILKELIELVSLGVP